MSAAAIHQSDVLIIGSGVAGLSAALSLAQDMQVRLLCKKLPEDSASYRAQGGIAAALGEEDSIEEHVADTLRAGAGLCNKKAVRFLVSRGEDSIHWLQSLGVNFSRTDGGQVHLGREGGHSLRRILHAEDATGRALVETLVDQARKHPNLHFHSDCIAVDLVTSNRRCQGAYALSLQQRQVEQFIAPFTLLATGGASRVYLYSTAPPGSSGDGIAMAWRAGCRVHNMEFNQFHPTCLYHPGSQGFLISEAVRGEGGHLLLPDGTRFMQRFDSRAELAPRDIVARGIDHEMKRLGIECVYLDISHRGPRFVEQHFPNISARCRELGLDMGRQPLPVVPAAHYSCGGVRSDHRGRSDVQNLYVAGEVASTGVHGANRLASNSLLECLVYGRAAAQDILQRRHLVPPPPPAPDWDESRVRTSDEDVVVEHNWEELRRSMWDYVGIVRSTRRLQRARQRIRLLQKESDEYYGRYRISGDLVELRNLCMSAELIIRSALRRRESRGLHYSADFPDTLPRAANTILRPPGFVAGTWEEPA